MIGGDVPYDHEAGGGPANGPTRHSPQSPQPSRSPQPREGWERAARAEPVPPPLPAPPAPEPTGDERVDAALSRFDELAAAPVADHVEVFEDVQRRLQDVLASVDHEEQPEPAAPETPSEVAPRPDPGLRPEPSSWGS